MGNKFGDTEGFKVLLLFLSWSFEYKNSLFYRNKGCRCLHLNLSNSLLCHCIERAKGLLGPTGSVYLNGNQYIAMSLDVDVWIKSVDSVDVLTQEWILDASFTTSTKLLSKRQKSLSLSVIHRMGQVCYSQDTWLPCFSLPLDGWNIKWKQATPHNMHTRSTSVMSIYILVICISSLNQLWCPLIYPSST